MQSRSRVPEILAASVVALVAAATMASGAVAAPAAASSGDTGLGKKDRELVATAIAQRKPTVTLIVATASGATSRVEAAIKGLGGTIGYREDSIGYLRAVVPTGKAGSVSGIAGVDGVDVDDVVPLEDPSPGPNGQVAPTPYPAPSASTPVVNPYMPIGDTGAAQFVQAHPTWDGRGTTIAIVDSGVDLAHPALQTTTTGERKIVDWVTMTDPTFSGTTNNDADPTWIQMGTQVSGPSFSAAGATWTAPAGAYRFGVFNERDARLGGEVGNDVNRDGNPAGSSGLFGVLWDTASNSVRVDANQNRSFADDPPMTDYKVNKDVAYFGTDNPATPIVERMPFVVQTDGKNKVVNIGIVSAAHGSHVAGITAANGMFGGAATGAAPGAKIVAIRVCLFVAGCTNHALLEGMIYAAKVANVDVINMSIGGLPALNDGNNARAELYDRLITQSNVQMFISAGNSGAGLNTIGDPSVASKVMSVGSYITNETWKSNYGSSTVNDRQDNMHPFSSRGPREDGGFKPQIIAPGSAVSTVPRWQDPDGKCLPYACSVGYAMFNGTSMASPQAAGAAALLVSAAKAGGFQHQPDQLRQAMNSSARFIPNYQAYEQGNGLIQVSQAWDLLKTNAETVDISSSVAVNAVLSGFLATPGVGTGIYDREGVRAGDSYTRTYTLTRTNGGGGTKTYAVSWVGGDGTFESGTSVSLPLNKAVSFPVRVHPIASGIHSAVMRLDDLANPGVEAETMNTVVAADQFNGANSYTVVKSGDAYRNQSKSYFVGVPVGVPAFKVDLQTTPLNAGQIRFLRFHPYGVGLEVNSTPNSYNPPVPGCSQFCTPGEATSRTVANPQPGVWEVAVEVRRTSDLVTVPFTLTMSILGATVTPNPDTIPSATLGVPVARSYTATNQFGGFTGRMVGSTLGSALRSTESIAQAAQKQYTVAVTPGTTSLRATIGSASDLAADLDLFVFNPDGTLVGQSADGDSEESVTIANPAAGTWTVLVDGFSVPAGTTTYKYVDVFTNSAFGSVSVTDANAVRPAGSAWTVPGTVTANAAPASGRVLLGAVQVRTDSNIVVGSGDVVVQAVTP